MKTALKKVDANTGYTFEKLDQLGCPTAGFTYSGRFRKPCCGIPIGCREAKNKTCVQYVDIFYCDDNRRFKRMLPFNFVVADNDHDGYIDERHILLRWLIDDLKIIKETDLDRV